MTPPQESCAQICLGSARFSLLTPTLLRLEYDPAKKFTDAPTLFAAKRNLACSELMIDETAPGHWKLRTP